MNNEQVIMYYLKYVKSINEPEVELQSELAYTVVYPQGYEPSAEDALSDAKEDINVVMAIHFCLN